jgi:hypothetical protein
MPHAGIIPPVMQPVARLFTETTVVDTTRCQYPRVCREENPQVDVLSVRSTFPNVLTVLYFCKLETSVLSRTSRQLVLPSEQRLDNAYSRTEAHGSKP